MAVSRFNPDLRIELVGLLPRLRRLALTLCGSADEADEVVQSACERALLRLEQFTPGTRLDSWMFQIIRNVWIDRLRYQRRHRMANLEDAGWLGYNARIFEQTAARMDLRIIRDEVAKLPEDQRTVLALITVEGLSYQETAVILDVPIGTVMSRLARSRRKLAKALDQPVRPTK